MSWRLRKHEKIFTLTSLLAFWISFVYCGSNILDTGCYGMFNYEIVVYSHKALRSLAVSVTQISVWSLESSQLILETKHLQTSMVIVS